MRAFIDFYADSPVCLVTLPAGSIVIGGCAVCQDSEVEMIESGALQEDREVANVG